MAFQIMNKVSPNSKKNTSIFCIFNAKDSRENLTLGNRPEHRWGRIAAEAVWSGRLGVPLSLEWAIWCLCLLPGTCATGYSACEIMSYPSSGARALGWASWASRIWNRTTCGVEDPVIVAGPGSWPGSSGHLLPDQVQRPAGTTLQVYGNSPVRMAGLKDIQGIFNSKDNCVKLTQANDVRWLSHHQAVAALRRTYPAVVMSLEREAVERNEAAAKGLAVFLKTPNFCATLMMLSDTLPLLIKLSRLFQIIIRKDIDYSHIEVNVDATIEALRKLKDSPGEHMTGLGDFLAEAKEKAGVDITYTERDRELFMKNIYHKFIDNVLENLMDRFPDNLLISSFNIFDPDEADQDQTNRLEVNTEPGSNCRMHKRPDDSGQSLPGDSATWPPGGRSCCWDREKTHNLGATTASC
ncbi:hypothetical protein Bbelb_035400 [Branchiostoma belcheri]|nr:hypothetical protein Bbelb_035400 [Branchiostoma belcheri]